jgi:cob(I)alamin adenosyltransferase
MNTYVHVYTGDGKGKTTAAMGLALRAAGAGLKVYFGQFMKKFDYSEILALKRFSDQITVVQFGTGHYVIGNPAPEDVEAARLGLEHIEAALHSGQYNMVIADEANVAVSCNLLKEEDVMALIRGKPASVELVLTGRRATANIIAAADLVTEMKAVKHYYTNGVTARKGIEC